MYKNGKLKRLVYHYHMYLKKRVQEDPEYLNRWNLTLMKKEPDFIEFDKALSVETQPAYKDSAGAPNNLNNQSTP